MKLLLDTHVFFWYISGDPKLPTHFLQTIQDPANEVYLSAASLSARGETRLLFTRPMQPLTADIVL